MSENVDLMEAFFTAVENVHGADAAERARKAPAPVRVWTAEDEVDWEAVAEAEHYARYDQPLPR